MLPSSSAAAMSAQQQAMSQLTGFNSQIKTKDDVTVQYQLVATGAELRGGCRMRSRVRRNRTARMC